MLRGSVKSTGYLLHSPVSPSLPLPCLTVCHHISTGLYHWAWCNSLWHWTETTKGVRRDIAVILCQTSNEVILTLETTHSRLYMTGNEQYEQIEARLLNHCCCQKAISIRYYEFVSIALIIQHALRMRRILLSSEVYPSLPCFFTWPHKRYVFRKKKVIEYKSVFWFSVQVLSKTILITERIQRDIVHVRRCSCKVPVILFTF